MFHPVRVFSHMGYGARIHKCPNFEIPITFYYINISTSSLDTKWKLTWIIPYFKGELMTHPLEVWLIKHQNVHFEKFLCSHKSQGVILSYTDSPSYYATFHRRFLRYRKVPLIYNLFSQNNIIFIKRNFKQHYKGYWLTIKITRMSVKCSWISQKTFVGHKTGE